MVSPQFSLLIILTMQSYKFYIFLTLSIYFILRFTSFSSSSSFGGGPSSMRSISTSTKIVNGKRIKTTKWVSLNPTYPQILQNHPPGFAWFWWIRYRHSIAQRIEHVAMCTKSTKLHRLLLLDSGLCIAKTWMLCICYCTNSIKVQQLGNLFTACWWILEDLGWFHTLYGSLIVTTVSF